MKKTILTTEKSFPYVKRRLEVIHSEKSELNPLEVAILNMDKKIAEIKEVLNRNPCDSKLLQMQLQGGIATTVHAVSHPPSYMYLLLYISYHGNYIKFMIIIIPGTFCYC